MLVSFDIYEILNVVELIVLLPLVMALFVKGQKAKVIRLVVSIILLIINVCQISMEIQMEKSYGITIGLIIIWSLNAVVNALSIGADK